MDDPTFAAFARGAENSLRRLLEENTHRHGLDQGARWFFDSDREPPCFQVWNADDRLLFETVALEVGTFVPSQSSWKWGWCNPSLSAAHQRRMLPLRELAATTGRSRFDTDQPFETDVEGAWTLAAIANAKLGGFGAYSARIRNREGQPIYAYLVYVSGS